MYKTPCCGESVSVLDIAKINKEDYELDLCRSFSLSEIVEVIETSMKEHDFFWGGEFVECPNCGCCVNTYDFDKVKTDIKLEISSNENQIRLF